jgi:hypothetical protein
VVIISILFVIDIFVFKEEEKQEEREEEEMLELVL